MPVTRNFVTNYSAPTNGQRRTDVSLATTAGIATLTVSPGIFNSGDVGKVISFRYPDVGAGTLAFTTTIFGFTSSTVITLAVAAPRNFGGITPLLWGSDCTSAMGAWQTEAAANDGSTLIIPAGVFCFAGGAAPGFYPIMNCSIIGAGSTLTYMNDVWPTRGPAPGVDDANSPFGDYRFDPSARIQTAVAGANKVTLRNAAQASKFAVGKWICVCGISDQSFGYPPNFQWLEYHKIASISSGDIFLDGTTLRYTYKSTWPDIDSIPITLTASAGTDTVVTMVNHGMVDNVTEFRINTDGIGTPPGGLAEINGIVFRAAVVDADHFKIHDQFGGANFQLTSAGSGVKLHFGGGDLAGSATIWCMNPAWDAEQTWQGFTTEPTPQVGGPGGLRKLTFNDVSIPRGYGPTAMREFIHNGGVMGELGGRTEVDKCMEFVTYNNLTGNLWHQNAGSTTVMTNSTIGLMDGTPGYMTIDGCDITDFGMGPSPNGVNFELTITDTHIGVVKSLRTYQRDTVEVVQSPNNPSLSAFRVHRYNDGQKLAGWVTSFNVPGAIFRYGQGQNIASTGQTDTLVQFEVTDSYSTSTHHYADTTLPWPQPDSPFAFLSTTFLTHTEPNVDGWSMVYWLYSPIQITVDNNTGADPVPLAFEEIPFDGVPTVTPKGRPRLRLR